MTSEDWFVAALTTAIGLVMGLATGFYFESRQLRRARAERDELRVDNQTLRVEIGELKAQLRRLNVNLTSNQTPTVPPTDLDSGKARVASTELASLIRDFVAHRLDASGTLARSRVLEHFAKAHNSADVEVALDLLIQSRVLEIVAKNRVRIAP